VNIHDARDIERLMERLVDLQDRIGEETDWMLLESF
jgi:hypothetical protein